eukprot:503089-Amphidinium_carterae.1
MTDHVFVRVERACAGEDVCVFRLLPLANLADLRREVANKERLLLSQVSFVSKEVKFEEWSSLAADVLPLDDSNEEPEKQQRFVQLVKLPRLTEEEVRNSRKLLSLSEDPPIQDTIDKGLVPIYVSYLYEDAHPALQLEAAWALTNIAAGSSSQTKVL